MPGGGREARPVSSLGVASQPSPPQAALPASTCLAADLIVAVTSCVKAGRVTPFLPSHPDWILLQSPDEVLHEPKLDQLPEVMVGEES